MIQGSFEEWLYSIRDELTQPTNWPKVAQLTLAYPKFVQFLKQHANFGRRNFRYGDPDYYDSGWFSLENLWEIEKAIEAVEELQAYFKETKNG